MTSNSSDGCCSFCGEPFATKHEHPTAAPQTVLVEIRECPNGHARRRVLDHAFTVVAESFGDKEDSDR